MDTKVPTAEQLCAANIHVFLEYYNISNDQGEKLDFYDHPFMWDIYDDWSPKIVCMKAAQVTFTTTVTHKTLWLAKHKRMDIIYSLPTDSLLREIVSGKVNRLIDHNPIYKSWTKDKDSIEQKRVGDSTIYYRATWTERGAISIPADLYISDETDRSKQSVVEQFSSRLQHSKYAWEWQFSNPSSPGNGVDKLWQESDQKHWFVECESCGHDWYITLDNIMGSPAYFGCTKCKKELNRRKGRWVAKYADKKISGYWIPLLICPWVSAEKILELKRTKDEMYFANFVMGLPYVGKGNTLTKNLLFQNLIDRINPQDTRPIIGVDPGVDIRYVIGNKYGIFFYGECKDYSELEKLLNRWSNAIMVIDQGGDITPQRALREKYPGRVFLCFYRQNQKNDDLINWDDEKGIVVADRNKCIQLVVDEFTDRRIPLFGKESEWWEYWLHWSHIYRTEEYNENTGITMYKWMRNDRDDWVHATVYWRIGMDRFMDTLVTFAEPKAVDIGSTGYEELPGGGTMFRPTFR